MTNTDDGWAARTAAQIETDDFTLGGMWDETVRTYPDRIAVDFLGKKWTYAALDEQVTRAANGLKALGAKQGDRIALCLPNTPYYVVLYFAILKIGAIAVNLNPLYTAYELRKLVADAGADIMAVPDLPLVVRNAQDLADAGILRKVIVCPMAGALPFPTSLAYRLLRREDQAAIPAQDAYLSYQELLNSPADPINAPIRRKDPAVFQYTGGTTGLPKAAVLSHGNLLSNCWQTAMFSHSHPDDHERVIGVLPLFHVFALTTVLNASILLGSEMILLPRYEQKQFIKTLNRTVPTRLFGVPTLFQAMISLPDKQFPDCTSLTLCVSGGAPLPAPIRAAFEEKAGCRLVEGYGLSETSPTVTCNPVDGSGKHGSAGIAYPDTVIEIRDPEDPQKLLPTGETGEVCIRGPQVMSGYWNRAEENGRIFVDGALRTGDVGYLDTDGYLFLVDRIKDVIICGGYNVYPRVIEDAIYEHPDVEEVIVIGLPDAYRGEAPKAYVVPRQGSGLGAAELFAHLKPRLSKIELPHEIEMRDSLPKTKIGKLSKAELKREVLADHPSANQDADQGKVRA